MQTDIGMNRLVRLIGGPVFLALGTTRWVGPVLFYIFWVGLSQNGRPTIMEVSAFLYLALVPTATWIGHVINGADDQRHREMHVAAAGSHARVSMYRATASFLAASALGLASLIVAIPRAGHLELFGFAVIVVVSAALTGVALVLPLSPPITDETGVALTSGLLGLLALTLFPPTQWSIRQLNAERSIGAFALLGGAVALALVSTAATRWLYHHRLSY